MIQYKQIPCVSLCAALTPCDARSATAFVHLNCLIEQTENSMLTGEIRAGH
jgi:hypothetical protein